MPVKKPEPKPPHELTRTSLESEVSALRQRTREHEAIEVDQALAAGIREYRCTKAWADTMRANFLAGEMSAKAVRAVVEHMPVRPELAAHEQALEQPPAGGHRWKGKTYAELKPAERARLKREAPALFAVMREHNTH